MDDGADDFGCFVEKKSKEEMCVPWGGGCVWNLFTGLGI